MSIEGQDSIFGQENSVANAQSSSQPQLPETENKLDDSIDNQQQVRLISGSSSKRRTLWLYESTFVNALYVSTQGLHLALLEISCRPTSDDNCYSSLHDYALLHRSIDDVFY